jgi:hypothetical protein
MSSEIENAIALGFGNCAQAALLDFSKRQHQTIEQPLIKGRV